MELVRFKMHHISKKVFEIIYNCLFEATCASFFLLKNMFIFYHIKQQHYRAVHILQLRHFHHQWLGFYNKMQHNSKEIPLVVGPIPVTHKDPSYQPLMTYACTRFHPWGLTHKSIMLTEKYFLVLSSQMREGIKIQLPIWDSGERASIKAFKK